MEQWGTGYKRIHESCLSGGYQTPIWQELGTAIRVVFSPHNATQENLPPQKPIKNFTKRQEKILTLLQKKGPLDAKKIHANIQEDLSNRSLRKELQELKEQGLVSLQGKGPSTVWRISAL
jgi:predicted HTH transcriptional regulator